MGRLRTGRLHGAELDRGRPHLPRKFRPVTPQSSFPLVNQVGWFGGILTLSVVLGWLYNNTGSVLLPMVLHTMANTVDVLIPLAPDRILIDGVVDQRAVALVTAVHVGVYALIALVIVAAYGRRRLSSKPVPGPRRAGARTGDAVSER